MSSTCSVPHRCNLISNNIISRQFFWCHVNDVLISIFHHKTSFVSTFVPMVPNCAERMSFHRHHRSCSRSPWCSSIRLECEKIELIFIVLQSHNKMRGRNCLSIITSQSGRNLIYRCASREEEKSQTRQRFIDVTDKNSSFRWSFLFRSLQSKTIMLWHHISLEQLNYVPNARR